MITSVCSMLLCCVTYLWWPIAGVNPSKVKKSFPHLPDHADSLDLYLENAEREISGTLRKPTLRKRISWHSATKEKTKFSIVYLHGFSASSPEIEPVVSDLSRQFQANVFFSRLAGHGTDNSKDLMVSPEDWISDAYEAYEIGKKIGEKVILMGSSFGATLSFLVASSANLEPALAGIIAISPYLELKDPLGKQLDRRGMYLLASQVKGKEIPAELVTPLQREIWTPSRPLIAVANSLGVVKYSQRQGYAHLNSIPILGFYSPSDEVVSAKAIERFFEDKQGPKKLVAVPATDHIVVGEATEPGNIEKVVREIVNSKNNGFFGN